MKKINILLIILFCGLLFQYNSSGIVIAKESGDTLDIKFSFHSKFLYFWDDFRRAVKTGNVDNVIKMTNFPFMDYYNKAYNRPTLTANDESEFRTLYKEIFKSSVIEICTYDYPIRCEDIESTDHLPEDCFTTDEKMFNPEYFFIICKDSDRNLLFGKVGGVYKLIGIKFL